MLQKKEGWVKKSKRIYVILADGFELIEALTPVDVLRRGMLEVITVALEEKMEVKSSNGVILNADELFEFERLKEGDMIILPGGYPGYENLRKSEKIQKLVKYYDEKNKYISAICGAPIILWENGILENRKFTCHTSILNMLGTENYLGDNVVVDCNIITSRGAGVSLEFSFELLNCFVDETSVKKVRAGMELWYYC